MEFEFEYLGDGELLPNMRPLLNGLKYKPFLYLFFLLIFESAVFVFFEIYDILRVFEPDHFMRHAPSTTFFILSAGLMIAQIRFTRAFLPSIEKFKKNFYWRVDEIPKDMRRMVWEDKVRQIGQVMEYALAQLWGIYQSFLWSKDESTVFVWTYIIEKYPVFVWPLRINIWMIILIVPIVMNIVFCFALYTYIYLKYQIQMLSICINNIDNGFENMTTESLLNNTMYQETVTRKLNFIIKRHGEIINNHNILKENGRNVNAAVFLLCLISITFAQINILMGNIPMTLAVLSNITNFLVYSGGVHFGQSIIDMLFKFLYSVVNVLHSMRDGNIN